MVLRTYLECPLVPSLLVVKRGNFCRMVCSETGVEVVVAVVGVVNWFHISSSLAAGEGLTFPKVAAQAGSSFSFRQKSR